MPSRQQIKSRIRSVTSTKQITRAMQLVSASKLRRAQEAVQGPRTYAEVAREMLTHLREVAKSEGGHELFRVRPVKSRLIIAIASDRSLAGAYNANIFRAVVQQLSDDRKAGVKTSVITIGRQVARSVARLKDVEAAGVYTDLPDKPETVSLRPILLSAFEKFTSGEVDDVTIIYTQFKSTVTQQVTSQRILPAGFTDVALDNEVKTAEIEPSVEELIDVTVVRFLEAQLYQAYLEAAASEHAIRMLAMKNATDNASDIIEDLTLEFNNARQAAITQELSEISAGVEALS